MSQLKKLKTYLCLTFKKRSRTLVVGKEERKGKEGTEEGIKERKEEE